jgi:transcriptional regulator of arginine metabolism
MKVRKSRHEAIRDIIRRQAVKTQRELVESLREEGYDCTQATVSRDITDMGLRKLGDGVYMLAEDIHLHKMVNELVHDVVAANNLVLVKTSSGTAAGVAAALDAAGLPGVLGSIAGDDTIVVITANDAQASLFTNGLLKLKVG